jgi:hypothetical protein
MREQCTGGGGSRPDLQLEEFSAVVQCVLLEIFTLFECF